MNYIKHTVAAHEHLRAQPTASTLHVALYWALFFQWNAAYFDRSIDLDHEAAMQAARIGNRKTYRATLYDLQAWGLLSYQPSKSKYQPSRCLLTDLSGAKVPQVKPPTRGRSALGENGLPGAEVPQALGAEVSPVAASPGAEVPQDSLLIQTSFQTATTNVGADTKKKEGEVFSGEGLSEVQMLDDTATHGEDAGSTDTPRGAGSAQATASKKIVAPEKKGVGEVTMRAAATAGPAEPRRKGSRPQRPEVPFAESDISTPELFAAVFAGTDYALADLRYYHALVANWRKDGEPPLRRDWKATATKFMLNDAADNRLKLAPGTQRPEPGAGHSDPVGSGIPATGYRSKRWD